jgi:hypothetical protein
MPGIPLPVEHRICLSTPGSPFKVALIKESTRLRTGREVLLRSALNFSLASSNIRYADTLPSSNQRLQEPSTV